MTTTVVQQKQSSTSFSKTRMMENRAFDYVYDKNYHLSTQTDHQIQAMKAKSGSSNIVNLKKIMFIVSYFILI